MTLPMKTATAAAIVGVSVAVYFMVTEAQATTLRLILWPAGMLGSEYEGGEKVLEFLVGTLEIAGNALLYGLAGWMLGKVIEISSRKQRR